MLFRPPDIFQRQPERNDETVLCREGDMRMYLDYFLLAVGAFFLIVAVALGLRLFLSRSRDREYRRVLHEETGHVDVVETMRQTRPESQPWTDKTQLASESDAITELPCGEPGETVKLRPDKDGVELDISPLQGKYELLREIQGGGMSRTFLARHRELGSVWIVKFVDGKYAELADEADVLRSMNHINLPQIIDIFQTAQGTYLVERFIEGYTLEEVLKQKQHIKEGLIYKWGIELAQVLNYLHSLETPIVHCDLKPSNIMVTHDNRLVLIDFGIAMRQGISRRAVGISQRYAAPEQFQGALLGGEMAMKRFGNLPASQPSWEIDERTDLYSMGAILFELVMGSYPTVETQELLPKTASRGLSSVIARCLQIEPSRRYQSAKELELALDSLVQMQTAMMRTLVKRRFAAACGVAALVIGLGTSASGAYINQVETQAIITMSPGEVSVTEQQGVQIRIQKETPSGKKYLVDPEKIEWSYSPDNIARIDGERLVGVNVGETTVHGEYRGKEISLHVTVVEPVEELVSVSLQYASDVEPQVYVGTSERDFIDGDIGSCAFVSPNSMAAGNGCLYIADSGCIRVLKDRAVSSIELEPGYITAEEVRCWGGDLFVLTGPWDDNDGAYFGIMKISGGNAEFVFYTEAAWSTIPDFQFTSDGTLWFIWQNLGTGVTSLHKLDTRTGESDWVVDLPESTAAMAVDEGDNFYLAVPEDGTIIRMEQGQSEWTYFAGVKGEKNFIDGTVANFYRPMSLAVKDTGLYVLDFDTVRRVVLSGEFAGVTETVAGIPMPETNPQVVLGAGYNCVFPASEQAALAVDSEGQLLLCDPKNSVIYLLCM